MRAYLVVGGHDVGEAQVTFGDVTSTPQNFGCLGAELQILLPTSLFDVAQQRLQLDTHTHTVLHRGLPSGRKYSLKKVGAHHT